MKKISVVLAYIGLLAVLCTSCYRQAGKSGEASSGQLVLPVQDGSSTASSEESSAKTGFSLAEDAYLPLDDSCFRYTPRDGYKTDDESILWFERGILSKQYFSIAALQKIYDTNARPDLFPAYPSDMPVPAGLVRQAERALFSGTEYEWLNLNYSKPQKLTYKQLSAMKLSKSAKEAVDDCCPADSFDIYAIYSFQADIDADGKKEIVLYIDSGGTGMFASLMILKQDNKGVYDVSYNPDTATDSMGTFNFNSYFIQVENRWYLVLIDFDYDYKCTTGITIADFKDGKPSRYVAVSKSNGTANCTPVDDEDSNPSVAKICKAEAKSILEYAVNTSEDRAYKNGGSAAASQDGCTLTVDANNDGKNETVTEAMWWSCNANETNLNERWYADAKKSQPMTAVFKDSYDFDNYNNESDAQNWLLHMMWFEKIDGKTYTFRVVRYMGSQLFLLNVFDVEGYTAKPVYSMYLDYSAKYAVKTGAVK